MNKMNEDTSLQKEFGKLIRQKRKEQELTQDKLSEIVGITDVYLRDLESGKYTATWIIWLRLCNVLNIDIDDFSDKFIVPDINEMKALLNI